MVKCDYATLTILPGDSGADLNEGLARVLDALYLTDYFDNFEVVASNIRYACIMRYADIQIKLPSIHNWAKIGICIEFSGQGLSYYSSQLNIKFFVSLRTAFNRFRSLCVEGFKTKCSRFDVAADDKVVGDGPGILNLDTISDCLMNRAFVTTFRSSKPDQTASDVVPFFIFDPSQVDDSLPVRYLESLNLTSGVLGKTIYLGSRVSNSFVRIYDKLAEQQVKQIDTGDISHWVRFEVEFKHCNAMSIFSAFCDAQTDQEFSAYCSRVFFDMIRFVDLDHSRRYECSTCSWWLAFLRSMASKGLCISKVERNAFVRSLKHYNETLSASFYALVAAGGIDFLNHLLQKGSEKNSKTKNRILSDYRCLCSLSESDRASAIAQACGSESPIDYWDRFTWNPNFKEDIYNLYESYFSVNVI